MAKEKENKEKLEQEIVGLDDGDLNEDGEGNGEEQAGKLAFLSKYKKVSLPVVIALGSFVISMVAVKFFAASSPEVSEEVSSENSDQPENSGLAKLSMENAQEQVNTISEEAMDDFSIDTSAIMNDLAFLDYTPEMEAEQKKQEDLANASSSDNSGKNSKGYSGMTPQDSVDTLNWLDKEMAKIDKAKAQNAKEMKKMKALEYKIDQALIKIEQAESSRIINLARLYDGMRPKQVGKLFENLDDKAVMAILPRMKSANAAKIMAIMPPKRAARISTKMITVLEE